MKKQQIKQVNNTIYIINTMLLNNTELHTNAYSHDK